MYKSPKINLDFYGLSSFFFAGGYMCLLNPFNKAEYGTRSVFKWSTASWHLPFFYTSCRAKVNEPTLPFYLPTVDVRRNDGLISFQRALARSETQTAFSKI